MADIQCKACKLIMDQSDSCRHECPESDGSRIERLEGDVERLRSLVHRLWARINTLEGHDEFEGMP